MYRRLWLHRDLVIALIRRQFQLRYRQSFVGFAWAILPPLMTLGVATLVFNKVIGVQTARAPYAIFTFAALAPWTLFTNSLSFGVGSVVSSQPLVTRLAFPRAALPISMVGVSMADLAIASLVYVAFAYATGHGIPLTGLWFPLLLLIEIVLVTGIVLFFCALNVFARDIRLIVPLFAQLWMFLTPVLYPLERVPEGLRGLYTANPMTGLVESFRRVLVFGEGPDLGLLLPAIVGAAAALVVGSWYFRATESRFADVI